MLGINVLVATAIQHFCVKTIAESVDARPDMTLVNERWVDLSEVDEILDSFDDSMRLALIIVGQTRESNELAALWLAKRKRLVVMYVDIVDEMVRFGLRDPNPIPLLNAVRELVESVDAESDDRIARVRLSLVGAEPEETVAEQETSENIPSDERPSDEVSEPLETKDDRPLLRASFNWINSTLLRVVEFKGEEGHESSDERGTTSNGKRDEYELEEELDNAIAAAEDSLEPLAVVFRAFRLERLEFRLMLLALAPELDLSFQRCMAFLLDETSPRVGTLALYCNILEISPENRGYLVEGGALSRWLVFEGYANRPAAADEPLRFDPYLAQWILGDAAALERDPRIRRVLRLEPWPGATILDRTDERVKAIALIRELRDQKNRDWTLLDGGDSPAWRALLELGASRIKGRKLKLIRVEAERLANADVLEIADAARRIGRIARLTRSVLVIDVTKAACIEGSADWLRVFFGALQHTRCRPAVICTDKAAMISLLGSTSSQFKREPALPAASRTSAMRVAAKLTGAFVTTDSAEALANQYPLHIDALEQAVFLARSQPSDAWKENAGFERLTAALKEFAAIGVSHLVDRIEPIFTLEQVVLPPDRKQQLLEIVDHVQLASRVLDDWKFREQLPYGRGVAALFFGSSGTGKTMAAMGIARRLGVQILRLDLSRVVSKYIGDTEKNLDRVFTDAQRCGAAILIDEADALFGKRSEVKDAHDRYANIEVAYLLQRMEAYDGLAILTTNMRKNLDPAFMRRLRFVIDFPRPDVTAREKIWRQCLPDGSHELTDPEFNQLARRLDITGGQIRQTTLRAAFIAAAAVERITLEHIAVAARAELAKQGLPPVDIDLTRIRRAA